LLHGQPVGRLALEAEGDALSGVRWADRGERARVTRLPPILKEARRQLERGGYSGGQGLKTKHKLLALEGVTLCHPERSEGSRRPRA
jgi:hypothetical protein